MKRITAAATYYAYARLRAAEFVPLMTHLRESAAEAQDGLLAAKTMEDVARLQGQLLTINKILQLVADGETLAAKVQK